MGNALRVDELWGAGPGNEAGAAYLETNTWLAPVLCTTPRPFEPKKPLEIPFMGQTILWTADRDRPFPAWIADALMELLGFAELSVGWNSYGGKPLQRAAIGPVLKLLIRTHERGRQADLVPLPDGGVGLRLADQGRSLEIDISADGTVEALLESDGSNDVEIGPGATVAEAEQILGQFATHS